MSFKLLAIRTLSHTDKELLRGLKKNIIYSFYNEYKFFSEDANETGISDEYAEVESIQYNPIVPLNLYGDNIIISAIVGQNGSGKSSLLEILYYFLFEYSRTFGLLDDCNGINAKQFNLEFYFLLDNEIHCVKWNNITLFEKTIYRFNNKSNIYKKDTKKNFEDVDKLIIPFYNIVTNYSIYGLNSNSEESKWLDKLFIKNDGYQTPIVLNPFREDGNININREFELANSRLLKVFLTTKYDSNDFNTSNLIKDIKVNQLLFKLDINKNLNVFVNDNNYELKELINEFIVINSYDIEHFFESLYKIFSVNIKFRKLKYSYNKIDFLNENTLFENCFDLSNLYIFKKIVKIVYNYKNYKVFKPIFESISIGDLETNSNLRTRFGTVYHKLFLTDSEKLNHIETIEHSKENYNLEFNKWGIMERYLLKYYSNYYDTNFINSIYNKFKGEKTGKTSIYESINSFLKFFNKCLNTTEIRTEYISLLLTKLNSDKSHVTLKLRQILKMQESNFFENLNVKDKKNLSTSDNENIIYYTVNNRYISNDKKLAIEEIPNAFLEPIFIFNKKGVNEPFELKYLSSGEQQLLHSIISISYHIDNLLSIINNEEKGEVVENSNERVLRTYSRINIILDEIELYYHPEFQRIYIENLIGLLKQSKYKEFRFNIIFSTHSPFILSDIPSQNVLKLKNGEPVPNDNINSFAANIHDLLNDEFFLDKGTIGAYSELKIKELIHFYHRVSLLDFEIDISKQNLDKIKLKEEYNINKQIFNFLAQNVGEPIYRSIIENKLKVIQSKLKINEKG